MAQSGHPAFDLDWNLVRSFVAVAEAGSLAAGARLLGIAHPTVARHMQQLEEALGFALFDRSSQGLKLNDSGLRLLEAAGAMQSHALAFQNLSEAEKSSPLERVRVTVSEMTAELLPHIAVLSVGHLEHRIPAVDILVNQEQLNLLDREADIAVRHVRPTQQELICRFLGNLPIDVYASDTYLAAFGKLSRTNIAEHRFVDAMSSAYFVRGARRAGLELSDDQVIFRSDSMACQRAAVIAGWGIGAFPQAIAEDVAGLQPALEEPRPLSLPVWLVARPGARDHQELRRLFDALSDSLATQLEAA